MGTVNYYQLGYDDGWEDVTLDNLFSYRNDWDWLEEDIAEYKDGYKDGYNEGERESGWSD